MAWMTRFTGLLSGKKASETLINPTDNAATPPLRRKLLHWELVPAGYVDELLKKAAEKDEGEGNNTTTNADGDDDEEQESSDSDSDSDSEDEEDNVYAPFEAIPDQTLADLVNQHFHTDSFAVEKRTNGASHHVVFLENPFHKVVLRIPIVATSELWQPQQAFIVKSEADTMTYIKRKLPTFPIADILAYDTTFDNIIGVPYTLMSCAKGKPSNDIWYNEKDDNCDKEAVGYPSAEREKVRVTFLTSLAKAMAQLRELEFDTIGMLLSPDGDPDTAVVCPYEGWDSLNPFNSTDRRYWQIPTYNHPSDYITDRFEKRFNPTWTSPAAQGSRKFFRIVFNCAPFNASLKHDGDENQSFVLQHNDLNFQNILADDDGTVTGILDWDGCGTVPRCVGFTTTPIFIQLDWELGYDLLNNEQMWPWVQAKYRDIYANAMAEACGKNISDAKFTKQSHLYYLAHRILFGDIRAKYDRSVDFADRILREIPMLRQEVDVGEFFTKLGEGWPEMEQLLEVEIPKVFQLSGNLSGSEKEIGLYT